MRGGVAEEDEFIEQIDFPEWTPLVPPPAATSFTHTADVGSPVETSSSSRRGVPRNQQPARRISAQNFASSVGLQGGDNTMMILSSPTNIPPPSTTHHVVSAAYNSHQRTTIGPLFGPHRRRRQFDASSAASADGVGSSEAGSTRARSRDSSCRDSVDEDVDEDDENDINQYGSTEGADRFGLRGQSGRSRGNAPHSSGQPTVDAGRGGRNSVTTTVAWHQRHPVSQQFIHAVVESEFVVYLSSTQRSVAKGYCLILFSFSVVAQILYINVVLIPLTRVLIAVVTVLWCLCGIAIHVLQMRANELQLASTAAALHLSIGESDASQEAEAAATAVVAYNDDGSDRGRGGDEESMSDSNQLRGINLKANSNENGSCIAGTSGDGQLTTITTADASTGVEGGAFTKAKGDVDDASRRINQSLRVMSQGLLSGSKPRQGQPPRRIHDGLQNPLSPLSSARRGRERERTDHEGDPQTEKSEEQPDMVALFSEDDSNRVKLRRNAQQHEWATMLVMLGNFVLGVAMFAGKGDCSTPAWSVSDQYRACFGVIQTDAVLLLTIVSSALLSPIRTMRFVVTHAILTTVYFACKFLPGMIPYIASYFWSSVALIGAEVFVCMVSVSFRERAVRDDFLLHVQRQLHMMETTKVRLQSERLISAQVPIEILRASSVATAPKTTSINEVSPFNSGEECDRECRKKLHWSNRFVVGTLTLRHFTEWSMSEKSPLEIVDCLQSLFTTFDLVRTRLAEKQDAVSRSIFYGNSANDSDSLNKDHNQAVPSLGTLARGHCFGDAYEMFFTKISSYTHPYQHQEAATNNDDESTPILASTSGTAAVASSIDTANVRLTQVQSHVMFLCTTLCQSSGMEQLRKLRLGGGGGGGGPLLVIDQAVTVGSGGWTVVDRTKNVCVIGPVVSLGLEALRGNGSEAAEGTPTVWLNVDAARLLHFPELHGTTISPHNLQQSLTMPQLTNVRREGYTVDIDQAVLRSLLDQVDPCSDDDGDDGRSTVGGRVLHRTAFQSAPLKTPFRLLFFPIRTTTAAATMTTSLEVEEDPQVSSSRELKFAAALSTSSKGQVLRRHEPHRRESDEGLLQQDSYSLTASPATTVARRTSIPEDKASVGHEVNNSNSNNNNSNPVYFHATRRLELIRNHSWSFWFVFSDPVTEAAFQEHDEINFTPGQITWASLASMISFASLALTNGITDPERTSGELGPSKGMFWISLGMILCTASIILSIFINSIHPRGPHIVASVVIQICYMTSIGVTPRNTFVGDAQMIWLFVLTNWSCQTPHWLPWYAEWARDSLSGILSLLRTLLMFDVSGSVKMLSLFFGVSHVVYCFALRVLMNHAQRESFALKKHVEFLKEEINKDLKLLERALEDHVPPGIVGECMHRARRKLAWYFGDANRSTLPQLLTLQRKHKTNPTWNNSFSTPAEETPFLLLQFFKGDGAGADGEMWGSAAAAGRPPSCVVSTVTSLSLATVISQQQHQLNQMGGRSAQSQNPTDRDMTQCNPLPSHHSYSALQKQAEIIHRLQIVVEQVTTHPLFRDVIQVVKVDAGEGILLCTAKSLHDGTDDYDELRCDAIVRLAGFISALLSSSRPSDGGGDGPSDGYCSLSRLHLEQQRKGNTSLPLSASSYRIIAATGPLVGSVLGLKTLSYEYYGAWMSRGLKVLQTLEWGSVIATDRVYDCHRLALMRLSSLGHRQRRPPRRNMGAAARRALAAASSAASSGPGGLFQPLLAKQTYKALGTGNTPLRIVFLPPKIV